MLLTDIVDVITSLNKTTCDFDPFPTSLLVQYIDLLSDPILLIVNQSIQTHAVPDVLKRAVVIPTVKNNLSHTEIKNFRPISNLSFLSKILEKVIHVQLTDYLNKNNLNDPMQSGFTTNCSTETALLKVQSDILDALGRNEVALMVLLDLSSAFDTLDHSQLLETLYVCYNVTDKALLWIESYLTDRKQFVRVRESRSNPFNLVCGVSQGSILGPLLFKMYISPLAAIIRKHNMCYHFYADDIQLYCSCDPSSLNATKARLENCIGDIMQWLTNNSLKCNETKREFMFLSKSKQAAASLTDLTITIGTSLITVKQHVKNLGSVFDSNMRIRCRLKGVDHIIHKNLGHKRNMSMLKFISKMSNFKL